MVAYQATTLERTAVPAATVDVTKATTAEDIQAIGGTLGRAFYADPVLAWTFPDALRRWRNLPGVFELYAQAFARHGETYMTAGSTGAALWLPPATPLLDESEEDAFAEQVAERAGADADRLSELMALLDEHHPPGRYYVLQLLAVEPQWQGQGIGSALLDTVLRRCDRDGVPAYLEATSELNAALYERHGFDVTAEIPLPDGPSLFAMWRDPA